MPSGSSLARKFAAVLSLVAALCALVLGGAGPALAHAGLSGSDPADGAVLDAAPKQVTLTFTESVSFLDGSLRVLSPADDRVSPRPAHHADGRANTAQVPLEENLAQGTYTVAWRVVSADGHPISGALVFSVGKPSGTTAVPAKTSPDDTAASRLYGFFRYVAYSGLALLVGAAAFVLVCWPGASGIRPLRRLLVVGWATLLASTVALLLLRSPYEAGGPLSSAFDPSLLGRTLAGRPGIALTARLVLLVLAALFWRQTRVRLGVRLRLVAGPALALGLALTWAGAEHASAGIQVPLAIPVAVLHLVAMAVWLGGLITLLSALRHRGPDGPEVPASAISRFSALAFGAVVVLVGTGVYQSWRQVGSWTALTTTSYGRTLGLKVAAVVLMLCVAALSRRWTGRLVGGAAPSATEPAAVELEQVRVPQTVGAPSAPEGTGPGGKEVASGRSGPGDDVEQPVFDAERYRRRLRRTVGAEAAVGAVVLVLSTLLTGSQPSRAAATTAPGQEPAVKVVTLPFDMGTAKHRGTVQITLAPGHVGENTVEAVVFTPDGGISSVPELRLALTQRDREIGPLDAKLENRKGYWATYDLRLPMAGTWNLDVTIRTTDIDQVTVSTTLRVTP
ncbi:MULTISPECIES: copper resistance CopC/CopD family protein [unclassified Streptomyces]|uniref:copper resistance CopC/CopD family protein n=1 Tax=unclassified Streptomyces TaxID=2593676 RepID=UPI002E0F48B3|nr:copper resistance protein CopC [Streptomyces sp. NBC_01296]WSW63330.1 copper resistance protein CopC [Streptomyces sp. NBC_00998]